MRRSTLGAVVALTTTLWASGCMPGTSLGDSATPDEAQDADGDSFPVSEDCDDQDPTVFPGAAEACNGKDDDCTGTIDEGLTQAFYADADHDGWGEGAPLQSCDVPAGYAPVPGDCDDAEASVHPEAKELCSDGIDQDCDGLVDAQDEDALGSQLSYADDDLDGYGDAATEERTCAGELPDGRTRDAGDCDDADPLVHPGAVEWCDEALTDEDCDGLVDAEDPDVRGASSHYPDGDGDGYGLETADAFVSCAKPAEGWVTNDWDCDDAAATIHPAAEEDCTDDVDNDCDGDFVCGPVGDLTVWDGALAITGSDTYELCGVAVEDVGDLDGDGVADIGVGSWLGGTMAAGLVSVFPGTSKGETETELASLSITSSASGDYAGWALDGAGDTDGDGFDDLAVGAYGIGRTYVFLGPATGEFEADAADGYVTGGGSDEAGFALADLGDLDGDGFDDLLVGAPSAGTDGRAYVVFGPVSGANALGSYPTIDGQGSGALGTSLDGASDLDGDGFRDLVMGAPDDTSGGSDAGAVYVVSGASASTDVALEDASAAMFGKTVASHLGASVGTADLDGDGHADLVAGAPGESAAKVGPAHPGAVYVQWGPLADAYSASDSDLSFEGEHDGSEAGYALAAGGDVDRDGFADLVVGSPGLADSDGVLVGGVYVLLGPLAGGTGELKSAHARVLGDSDAGTGWSVGFLSDPEGDGTDDLLMGAPLLYVDGKANVGAAYRFTGWEF